MRIKKCKIEKVYKKEHKLYSLFSQPDVPSTILTHIKTAGKKKKFKSFVFVLCGELYISVTGFWFERGIVK